MDTPLNGVLSRKKISTVLFKPGCYGVVDVIWPFHSKYLEVLPILRGYTSRITFVYLFKSRCCYLEGFLDATFAVVISGGTTSRER